MGSEPMPRQQLLFPEDQEYYRKSRTYGTPEFRQAYAKYITSTPWKKLCKQLWERADGRCERCQRKPKRREVHHITYDRFTCELLSDLQALCPDCHKEADEERERRNRAKFERACEEGRDRNAKNTYLTKKYGEDWESNYSYDQERLDDEAAAWLEEKRDREEYEY